MNKYWEIEKNRLGNDLYVLFFSKFGNEYEEILAFSQDVEYKGFFLYCSKELGVEEDELYAESVDEAKEIFEDMIEEYYENKIRYYADLLIEFREK